MKREVKREHFPWRRFLAASDLLPSTRTITTSALSLRAHFLRFRFITRSCDFRFQSSILALEEQRNF
jgi:hypothetical protein